MNDLNIHDDFLDDFSFMVQEAKSAEYYGRKYFYNVMGLKEGWTGVRSHCIKRKYPEMVRKIEETTGKIVGRLHFFRIDGKKKRYLQKNRKFALRPHADEFPWAGVIYLWGNTGTYYKGELIEFKENRFIWYDAYQLHTPDVPDEDRCVIVIFMLDKSS